MLGEIDGQPENIEHAAVDMTPAQLAIASVERFRVPAAQVGNLVNSQSREFLHELLADAGDFTQRLPSRFSIPGQAPRQSLTLGRAEVGDAAGHIRGIDLNAELPGDLGGGENTAHQHLAVFATIHHQGVLPPHGF